jgi:hypothetical protein
MLMEPNDQLERERLLEPDRQAWKLPSPPVHPVGRVRDVWPVHPSVATRGAEHRLVEGPAAA